MIHIGDCLEVMRTMADNSVDAIVTDPPYGLSFMGKRWDYDVPSTETWAECLRVLKPAATCWPSRAPARSTAWPRESRTPASRSAT
ncbi:hypothetical protein NMB32_14420 [Stenotrophomonas sp. CD2]|nr:hypothetical protein NMB32_14420 [Stenotrophomonas sp. CD2]